MPSAAPRSVRGFPPERAVDAAPRAVLDPRLRVCRHGRGTGRSVLGGVGPLPPRGFRAMALCAPGGGRRLSHRALFAGRAFAGSTRRGRGGPPHGGCPVPSVPGDPFGGRPGGARGSARGRSRTGFALPAAP